MTGVHACAAAPPPPPPPAALQTRTAVRGRDAGHGPRRHARAGNSTGIECAVHTTTPPPPPGDDGDGDVVLATAPLAGASPRERGHHQSTSPPALCFFCRSHPRLGARAGGPSHRSREVAVAAEYRIPAGEAHRNSTTGRWILT